MANSEDKSKATGAGDPPASLPQRPASFAGSLPSLADSIGIDLPKLASRAQRHSVPILPAPPKLFIPNYTKLCVDGLPINEYQICGRPYSMQQPTNEGVSSFSRKTATGRDLSYRLRVIQQPEKARACGSGPRSSADRRPVDPPPVVRLTIFEKGVDITTSYDAAFMLYASLDLARPIANGRMHSAQIAPVLTGVAVAGIAYLDRPKPAGYFIFPDLSVRHEGWYRLRFHLFEQVKHANDVDCDRPFECAPKETCDGPTEPLQHEAMANRMFVYSAPFQVFGAKKFPGLNTSTELSKVVADQGCRVRIRREIRQRRKPKTKDEGDDDTRKSINTTPEPVSHHRSMSRDGGEASRQQVSSETRAGPTSLPHPSMNRPQPVMTRTPYHQSEQRTIFRPENDTKTFTPLPQLPPSNFSRTVTPSTEQMPFTLPPISSLRDVGSSAPPRPRAYNLPEPTPQKRSYSPRAYSQESSLKDGARPESTPAPVPQKNGHVPSWTNGDRPQPLNGLDQVIEADVDGGDHSDSEDSILDGPFTYRRADGTRSGRLLVTPTGY